MNRIPEPVDDIKYMKMALELAGKGEGSTSPNPMVGAVVVKDGEIVGRGYHKAAGTPHAEVNAIDDAGGKIPGGTIYVTLEPCNHHGRTPPCTGKILDAGLSKVVMAMEDPNPGVAGGGADYLRSKGVEVVSGVCQEEARELNLAFAKYIRTGRPFVTLKCAATLDGRIATKTGDSRWVSGDESRAFVHRLRNAVDAIMVGVDTVKQDDPSLTTRMEGEKGVDPIRIILDSRLSIPGGAKLLGQESNAGNIIVTGQDIDEAKKQVIEGLGATVLKTTLKDGLIDLSSLMEELGRREITSLLIEGGSRVIASSLKAGIIDRLMLFFAPKLLGGDDGVPICKGPGPDLMAGCVPVKDMKVRRFGEDIMIQGRIEG